MRYKKNFFCLFFLFWGHTHLSGVPPVSTLIEKSRTPSQHRTRVHEHARRTPYPCAISPLGLSTALLRPLSLGATAMNPSAWLSLVLGAGEREGTLGWATTNQQGLGTSDHHYGLQCESQILGGLSNILVMLRVPSWLLAGSGDPDQRKPMDGFITIAVKR